MEPIEADDDTWIEYPISRPATTCAFENIHAGRRCDLIDSVRHRRFPFSYEKALEQVKHLSTKEKQVFLHNSLNGSDIEAVRAVLDSGADVNRQFKPQVDYPVHLASQDPDMLEMLVTQYKAKLHVLNRQHWTPLHKAVMNIQHFRSIKFLIAQGADLESRDTNGETPLMHAAKCGNVIAFKMLLKAGANPHAVSKERGTLLHCAASTNSAPEGLRIIQIILDTLGRDVLNHPDKYGRTPIFYARTVPIVDLLARSGANMNYTDRIGNTPILYQVRWGYLVLSYELLVAFVANGADPNYRHPGLGLTILHILSLAEQTLQTVEYLIDNGADPSAKLTKRGVKQIKAYSGQAPCANATPLHVAAMRNNIELVKIMLSREIGQRMLRDDPATWSPYAT